ncbi:MAG: hypothetical protein OEL77_02085 [Nitrosopumilus sp.]|nr:hypothetical protein [Nitrosopumilus sp.]MDH3384786.1 hypothetical protein [Nitrosopumilus sp.]
MKEWRYYFAMRLSKKCREDRACRHCESEWFFFATIKSDILFDFLPEERWRRRRSDPNWMRGKISKK